MIKLMLHNNCDELLDYKLKYPSDFIINLLSFPVSENETVLLRKDIANTLSIGRKRYTGKSLHICPFIHVYELINFIESTIMYFDDVTVSGFISESIQPDDSIEKYYRDMKLMSKYILKENMFYNDNGNIIKYNGRF